MESTELELVLRLRSGDRGAFEQLFKTHYQRLCTYAHSFLKNIDEAEETVQQVFYQLWEKRVSIEINTSIKSYLYRSIHNSCLNKLKHLKIREEYKQAVTMQQEKSSNNALQKVIVKELEKQLSIAINSLPEQCKLIFKLSRFENLKYAEIASQLNISEKTVENQMGKALKNLREKLKEYLVLVVGIVINLLN